MTLLEQQRSVIEEQLRKHGYNPTGKEDYRELVVKLALLK